MSSPPITFSALPMVSTDEEARLVHLTDGQYFVKRGGAAHAEMTCAHLDDTVLVGNPAWRIATSDQCRSLKVGWCESCCA